MAACFFRRISDSTRGDLIGGFVISLFLFAGTGVRTVGLIYTSAGKQAFLAASYVIMVPFLIWGMRRIFPGWLVIAGSLVCFAGMGLLTSDVSDPLNIGDVLSTVSALFIAGHIISIGYYAKNGDPFVLVFVQFFVTSILSFCTAMIFHGAPAFQGTQGLFEIAYITLIGTFACFLLQNVALKYTSTTHASIILGLQSVFGVLGGIFFLGEVFTFKMIVGCCLIFSAIVLVELKK